jgi:hypothetical protein
MEALLRARSHVSRAVGLMLMTSSDQPGEPVLGWVTKLETEVIPALSGLFRWVEKLSRRPR